MRYCVNPYCPERENRDDSDTCVECGTRLLINDRFWIVAPLTARRPSEHSQVYEIKDLQRPEYRQIMKTVWREGRLRDIKAIELLQRESSLLPILCHPGIPKAEYDNYFEFNTTDDLTLHCMVMEYVEGQNLLDWINENQPISDVSALDWLLQLARILHVIHPMGFFHRDLKPDNIILKSSGELVLIDFGAVREITGTYQNKLSVDPSEYGAASPEYTITRIYTHGYAPPEQINGRAIAISDFFALGRTIIHLATGVHPEYLPEDDDTAKLVWRDKAPQISNALANYIDKLTERNPRKRPLNTDELIQDLTELVPKAIRRGRFFGSKWVRLVAASATIAVFCICGRIVQVEWSKTLVKDGELLLNKFQYESAIKKFELATQIDPGNDIPYSFLAAACFETRNIPCALENYQRALEKGPSDLRGQNLANIGRLYDEIGQFDEARRYYRRALEASNGLEAYPVNNLARLDLLQSKASEAKKRLLPLLKQKNETLDMISVFKNLGWSEFQLGNYKSAQNYLENSIAIQLEVMKRDRSRVVSPGDPYCLLFKVQEQLKSIDKETYKACLLLQTDTPEANEWKIEIIDRFGAN